APAAMTRAFSLGQPCTGLIRRSFESPKFAMARAVAPMFSPSCGSTRITTGAGPAIHRLVLSVPAPGMTLLMHGGACSVEVPHAVRSYFCLEDWQTVLSAFHSAPERISGPV